MKSSTVWNFIPSSSKFGSGICFLPYMPMSLYKWNMTSRSETPVVGKTVYVHLRPVTNISYVRGEGTFFDGLAEGARGQTGIGNVKVIMIQLFFMRVPFIESHFNTLRKIFFHIQHCHCILAQVHH
jgi:hypothetical protein